MKYEVGQRVCMCSRTGVKVGGTVTKVGRKLLTVEPARHPDGNSVVYRIDTGRRNVSWNDDYVQTAEEFTADNRSHAETLRERLLGGHA